jgi:hypothetical protein
LGAGQAGGRKKNLRHLPKITTTCIMPPPHPHPCIVQKNVYLNFFSQSNNMSNPSWGNEKQMKNQNYISLVLGIGLGF